MRLRGVRVAGWLPTRLATELNELKVMSAGLGGRGLLAVRATCARSDACCESTAGGLDGLFILASFNQSTPSEGGIAFRKAGLSWV